MGTLVAGYATSHAFALIEPEDWDILRIGNRKRYTERTGHVPTEHPAVAQETLEGNKARYQRIRSAHGAVRQHLKDINPDVLIVVGDDQNENLHADNLPQFAVYVGSDYDTARRFKSRERHFRCHQALAHDIMEKGVARGFDLGSLGTFADNRLVSHAHVQVLDAFLEDAQIPTVLVFVNAIHYPATEPARCYALGQLLADIMRDRPPHSARSSSVRAACRTSPPAIPGRRTKGPGDTVRSAKNLIAICWQRSKPAKVASLPI